VREIGSDGPLRVVFTLFVHEGPDRDFDLEVMAVRAGPVRAFAMPPPVGVKLWMKPKAHERIEVWARDEIHRSASASVSAVRPSSRDELLAAKTEAAATAVTGRDLDLDFVDEHDPGMDDAGRRPTRNR
jgi:hypothetical protein